MIDDLFVEMCKDGLVLKLNGLDGQMRIGSLLELWNKVMDEQGVSAKEDDKRKVIDLLGSDVDGGCKQRGVHGMCGIGNRTLTQLFYNNSVNLLRITRVRVLFSAG
uniref:Putative disease resistance RPP13-like protein 1 n=1 Tax=Anthurium amnicola TaxID=1678845 RepID=A0A1D1XJ00_9ARAE